MGQIQEVWAIFWPILEMVWQQIDPETKKRWLIEGAVIMVIWLLFWKKVVKQTIKPSLVAILWANLYLNLLWIVPVVRFYYSFREEYPVLYELTSYLLNTQVTEEFRSRLVGFALALAVPLLYTVLIQWMIEWILYLLKRSIKSKVAKPWFEVVKGMYKLVAIISLPIMFVLSLNTFSGGSPATGSALAYPPGYNQEMWGYIEQGVARAAQNGVYCDPYVIASLKVYETGQYICTEADETTEVGPCVSSAGAISSLQFLYETYWRNAQRHGVTGTPWNNVNVVEVACYTIAEEVNLDLSQKRDEFIRNFSDPDAGFVWNMDPAGGGDVYDYAVYLRDQAIESAIAAGSSTPSLQGQNQGDILLWPAPVGSRVTFGWGIPMWYGKDHNGMDVVLQDQAENFLAFPVYAVANGRAYYRVGDDCNAGIITLETGDGETFLYVHMEYEESLIKIPTDGTWVPVVMGQELGWVLTGTTTCSDGTHLHLMREDGSVISQNEFYIP